MIGKSTKKTTTFEVGQLIRYRCGGMRFRTLGLIVEKGFMQTKKHNPVLGSAKLRLPPEVYIDVQWLSVGDLMPKQVPRRCFHNEVDFWVGSDRIAGRREDYEWKKPAHGVVCRHPANDWFEVVNEINND